MIKKRAEKASELKLTVQPYIVVVGSCTTAVTGSYVIIDNYRYKVCSLLQALDFTFKAFHTLNAQYAKESGHIWQLPEKGLFKIKAPGTEIPGVLTVLRDMDNA